MGKLGRGWQLAKMSLGVIRKDKEILIFPFLSIIFGTAILISFIVGTYFTFGLTGFLSPIFWVTLFLIYLILYFTVLYFDVAMIGCAMIRLEGGDPTVRDGLRTASKNLGAIFRWTLISATVGAILALVEAVVKRIGRVIRIIGGAAWSVATFFVLPVLIYEKTSISKSMSRSTSLFKTNWGELVTGESSLLVIFLPLVLLGLIPLFFSVSGPPFARELQLWAIAVAGIYWLILACVASAADKILVAALYRYATTRKISPGFTAEHIKNPWG